MVVDAKMDVIKIPGLSAQLSDEEGSSQMLRRFMVANNMKSSVNTLLIDAKEEWERITTQFSSTPQLIQEYLTIACGAAGIPVSRVIGMAKGKGLNSEGGGETDTRTYYDGISSTQKNEISPVLHVLDEVLVRSAIGHNDDSIYYEWNPLWQMSDTEKAEVASKKATTAQAHVTMALINPDVLRKSVINQLIEDGTYPGIEDAIEEFGEEPPEPEEPDEEMITQHLGMMQKSAGQLKQIGKAAGLDKPVQDADWDESKHPRDKDGQFIEVESYDGERYRGTHLNEGIDANGEHGVWIHNAQRLVKKTGKYQNTKRQYRIARNENTYKTIKEDLK